MSDKHSAETAKPMAATEPVATYKKPTGGNPALRMLGIPNLPSKLPSRNWMIFLTLSTALASAIIYDKREKKRATAKWHQVVSELGRQPLANGNELPRRLTIFLAAPPGDGLRSAQDYYLEFIKPVLSDSGLDWEFVQGRQQGDIRAAVAEKIRRRRRESEGIPQEALTTAQRIDAFRREKGLPEYEGIRGDIVVGRHAWKEYVRGTHEGWLGPLECPSHLVVPETPKPEAEKTEADSEKKEKERPPQPPSYNSTSEYPDEDIPRYIPGVFDPAQPVVYPHLLGFAGTFTRLWRYFNRRKLADEVGAQVAAACFAAHRGWALDPAPESSEFAGQNEVQSALAWEEKDWGKWVWEDEKPPAEGEEVPKIKKERVWKHDVVLDPRISERMRRFELLPEVQQKADLVVVPEEKLEGWTKGSLRQLWRWGVKQVQGQQKKPTVEVDDE
ncbi:Mitochondrial import inner membrane translocase subunit tim-54 [Ceratocystis platani]|uniref:Mitochondrial import inner membrane translocase subunit TIM54 n=1 Tax=Ceratocystis fimbriata f. sp. platani TaxID=88771 RepID=A0A0F8BWS0_CERFI|nr:Mitochondrial import inner membrane translocase subunit tim-54 [Ceratocystis platani]